MSFAAIFAIIKAIPQLMSWVEQFMVWYMEREYANMKQENRDAISKAMSQNDQRPIEQLINPDGAGVASGHAGTVIKKSLPGVK